MRGRGLCRDHGHMGEACSPEQRVPKGCLVGLKHGGRVEREEGAEKSCQTKISKSQTEWDPRDNGAPGEGEASGEADEGAGKGHRALESWVEGWI